MRTLFTLTLILVLSTASSTYCQDSARIDVDFKVPKGWKKLNDTIYVIKNYTKELNEWVSYLAQGHMPWRYDPKNIAVTCLWSFGITNHTPVFEFADYLEEIKKDEIYSLTVDSTDYIIYVRIKKNVPIAYKFVISPSQ
ncbi:MAG: hypothetical protein ABSD46_06330 [Bacteroidota bacterium]